jgi:Tetratricopeptide repeat
MTSKGLKCTFTFLARWAILANNLAKLHYTQGNYPAAESLWTRSVQIRTQQLDPNYPDIATGLSNLATVYRA